MDMVWTHYIGRVAMRPHQIWTNWDNAEGETATDESPERTAIRGLQDKVDGPLNRAIYNLSSHRTFLHLYLGTGLTSSFCRMLRMERSLRAFSASDRV